MKPSRADVKEREQFSSGGKTYWLILRGQWGLKIDRHIVRWTGLSLVTWQYAKAHGAPYRDVILLTTTGARTGAPRRSVLPFYEWKESFVIVGSNGGGPKDPNWTTNLRANPRCNIRIKRRSTPVLARVAEGEERAELLEFLAAIQPFVRNYDAETARNGRQLPLVILTPTAGARG